MKLFEKPRVELVGRQVLSIEGLIRFLDENDCLWPELRNKLDSNMDLGDKDCEWLIETAGRTCYMSFDGKGRDHDGHIKNLIEVAHGACIEHATFNFEIWGVSRSLTHELVRHRIGMSYSQLSQRYVDSSDCAFVVPPAIQQLKETEPVFYDTWIAHMERSQELYSRFTEVLGEMYSDIESKLKKRKKARQAARSVLPNATETKLFVTGNARSVRHLIELRANPAADLEIRMLAVEIFRIMEREFPILLHGMKIVTLPDGTEGIESDYRRV